MKRTINSALLSEITTESVIDQAYVWVCKQRHHYPHNADIWHFRYYWQTNKQLLMATLRSGRYLFSPLQRITLANGNVIHLWSAQDALVMKAIAIVLTPSLSISPRCRHTKGHGGLKGALRWLHRKLPFHRFVFRSDVKGYYQSIDHSILIKQLEQQVQNHDVIALLTQVIRRTVEWGGTFKTINRGVGRGSPLSPLFAAVYLKPLDDTWIRLGSTMCANWMIGWCSAKLAGNCAARWP